METRRIGELEVSLLGIGCDNFGMKLDQQGTAAVVHAALDLGIDYFDTADACGESEVLLSQALGGRRDEAVIATKFGSPSAVPDGEIAGSASWVAAAADRSLRGLGIDVIDQMFDAVEALIAHAETQGRSILELAMSWLARRPSIPTIITGATTLDQVAANAAAMQWDLDEDQLAAIDELRPS